MKHDAFAAGVGLLDVEWLEMPDTVFFLARGGLRRLSRSESGFLGHAPEDIFWRDLLELVHEEDLAIVEAEISHVKRTPGAYGRVEARMRDAWGAWRPVQTTIENVIEVPGDGGLVVANVRGVPESSCSTVNGARRCP